MAITGSRTPEEEEEVKTALRFLELVVARKPKDARDLFTPGCVHHNPYLADGMDALLDSIAAVQGSQEQGSQDMRLDTEHVLVEGDLVAVHTNVRSSSDKSKGFRQIHLFRFEGGKVAEYWDVTQTAPEDSPNAYRMF